MASFFNMKGTTNNAFKIGVKGPELINVTNNELKLSVNNFRIGEEGPLLIGSNENNIISLKTTANDFQIGSNGPELINDNNGLKLSSNIFSIGNENTVSLINTDGVLNITSNTLKIGITPITISNVASVLKLSSNTLEIGTNGIELKSENGSLKTNADKIVFDSNGEKYISGDSYTGTAANASKLGNKLPEYYASVEYVQTEDSKKVDNTTYEQDQSDIQRKFNSIDTILGVNDSSGQSITGRINAINEKIGASTDSTTNTIFGYINTKDDEIKASIGTNNVSNTTVFSRIESLESNKVDKTTTINNHALSNNITITQSDVGLSDVVNSGDSAEPVQDSNKKFTAGGAYTLRQTINNNITNIQNTIGDAERPAEGTIRSDIVDLYVSKVDASSYNEDISGINNLIDTKVDKTDYNAAVGSINNAIHALEGNKVDQSDYDTKIASLENAGTSITDSIGSNTDSTNNTVYGFFNNKISNVDNDISSINDKISDAASSANKLTDKSYVDTTISTNISSITSKMSNDASSSNKLMDKAYIDTQISEATDPITAKISENASSNNKLIDKAYVDTKTNNINNLIPESTTTTNHLVNKDFVNSSIENMAAFYVTKRVPKIVDNNTEYEYTPFNTKSDLLSAIAGEFYIGGVEKNPGLNDYCIILEDESKKAEDALVGPTTRYMYSKPNTEAYDKNAWVFQYIVNNSGLTSDQMKAVNSGITEETVSDITSHLVANNPHGITKSTIGLDNVLNTGDTATPTQDSNKKFTAGGAYTLKQSIDSISDKIPSTASSENKLVDSSSVSERIATAKSEAITESTLTAYGYVSNHAALKNNPHEVTKEQVGLGNVNNTSDMNKPVSTATQTELDKKVNKTNGEVLNSLNVILAADTTDIDSTRGSGLNVSNHAENKYVAIDFNDIQAFNSDANDNNAEKDTNNNTTGYGKLYINDYGGDVKIAKKGTTEINKLKVSNDSSFTGQVKINLGDVKTLETQPKGLVITDTRTNDNKIASIAIDADDIQAYSYNTSTSSYTTTSLYLNDINGNTYISSNGKTVVKNFETTGTSTFGGNITVNGQSTINLGNTSMNSTTPRGLVVSNNSEKIAINGNDIQAFKNNAVASIYVNGFGGDTYISYDPNLSTNNKVLVRNIQIAGDITASDTSRVCNIYEGGDVWLAKGKKAFVSDIQVYGKLLGNDNGNVCVGSDTYSQNLLVFGNLVIGGLSNFNNNVVIGSGNYGDATNKDLTVYGSFATFVTHTAILDATTLTATTANITNIPSTISIGTQHTGKVTFNGQITQGTTFEKDFEVYSTDAEAGNPSGRLHIESTHESGNPISYITADVTGNMGWGTGGSDLGIYAKDIKIVPNGKILINTGTRDTESGNVFSTGNATKQIRYDNEDIQGYDGSSYSNIYLNDYGSNVVIAKKGTAFVNNLQVTGTSGISTSSSHINITKTAIQAYSGSSSTSKLSINTSGGDVDLATSGTTKVKNLTATGNVNVNGGMKVSNPDFDNIDSVVTVNYLNSVLPTQTTQSQTPVSIKVKGSYNINTQYGPRIVQVSQGSNCPSSSQYGVALNFPYRSANTESASKPGFMGQIFIPNGDDGSANSRNGRNSMYYRTSLENDWNAWQEVVAMNKSTGEINLWARKQNDGSAVTSKTGYVNGKTISVDNNGDGTVENEVGRSAFLKSNNSGEVYWGSGISERFERSSTGTSTLNSLYTPDFISKNYSKVIVFGESEDMRYSAVFDIQEITKNTKSNCPPLSIRNGDRTTNRRIAVRYYYDGTPHFQVETLENWSRACMMFCN